MRTMLAQDEAFDLIDLFGSDLDLWPDVERSKIDAAVSSDSEVADYLADMKRIDEMLDNWDEDANGASVNWDDEWDKQDEPDADDDEQDEPDDQDSDSDSDDGFGAGDGKQDQNDDDDEDQEGIDIPSTPSFEAQLPDASDEPDAEEEGEIEAEEAIEYDVSDIKDMDETLLEVIRAAIEDDSVEEFRVFTRDYDDLVEINAPEHTPIDAISQAVAKSTGVLAKDLRRLIAARSQVKRTPGMRRGRLHSPNLHRIIAGDDRVFTRREEANSLDTAISLVIDCSGSMSGKPIALAAEASYALGEVLNRIGVQFECLGFTDNWQHPILRDPEYQRELQAADAILPIARHAPIEIPKFKAFDERWTKPVQRRFANVYNCRGSGNVGFRMGSTPEGCGMDFAARRLLARKEARKIMIVMTDGDPCGPIFNYGAYGSDPYGRQSRDMVKAISAAGVDLIGIGIQHKGPTAYYPNSMVINKIEDMPAQLMALLKRFIIG